MGSVEERMSGRSGFTKVFISYAGEIKCNSVFFFQVDRVYARAEYRCRDFGQQSVRHGR